VSNLPVSGTLNASQMHWCVVKTATNGGSSPYTAPAGYSAPSATIYPGLSQLGLTYACNTYSGSTNCCVNNLSDQIGGAGLGSGTTTVTVNPGTTTATGITLKSTSAGYVASFTPCPASPAAQYNQGQTYSPAPTLTATVSGSSTSYTVSFQTLYSSARTLENCTTSPLPLASNLTATITGPTGYTYDSGTMTATGPAGDYTISLGLSSLPVLTSPITFEFIAQVEDASGQYVLSTNASAVRVNPKPCGAGTATATNSSCNVSLPANTASGNSPSLSCPSACTGTVTATCNSGNAAPEWTYTNNCYKKCSGPDSTTNGSCVGKIPAGTYTSGSPASPATYTGSCVVNATNGCTGSGTMTATCFDGSWTTPASNTCG